MWVAVIDYVIDLDYYLIGVRGALHCQSATLTDISPPKGEELNRKVLLLIASLCRNFQIVFRFAERALICQAAKPLDTFPRRGKDLI